MTYVSERKEGKNQLFSSIPYMEVENSVLFISVRVFFLEIMKSIMEGGWYSLPDCFFF